MEATDEAEARAYLLQAATSLTTIETYFHSLMIHHDLAPGTSDAQGLETYINHIIQVHHAISFLFVKPAGRRDRLKTEAELETVFVPLQVQDPETRKQPDRHRKQPPPDELLRQEMERQQEQTTGELELGLRGGK